MTLAPLNCSPGRQLLWDSCITHNPWARVLRSARARLREGALAKNGATCYEPVGIIRPSESVLKPSESVLKKLASETRRSDTTTREGRHNSMTNPS